MSVLVYTENWDGKFKKLSFELVSYAAKVASLLGSSVTAISIGKVEATELAKLGRLRCGHRFVCGGWESGWTG